MAPLFRVNGACASALALGFVGGYPVGARTAISLYQSGQCSKTEAERLLAFCNNSGPAFIFGVVGAGVFGSGTLGLLLYLVHMAASLLVGLLFRFYRPGEGPRRGRLQGAQFQTASFPAAFTHSVTGALSSTLNICAFVLFFTVIIRMLSLTGVLTGLARLLSLLFGPLGFDQSWARRLLTGVLEVSSGVSSLTDGSLSGRLSMAAFMLGWAGLSVHCQVLAFLGTAVCLCVPTWWESFSTGGCPPRCWDCWSPSSLWRPPSPPTWRSRRKPWPLWTFSRPSPSPPRPPGAPGCCCLPWPSGW